MNKVRIVQNISIGIKNTGLVELVADNVAQLSALTPWLLILVVCLCVTFLTEMMSNTGNAAIIVYL